MCVSTKPNVTDDSTAMMQPTAVVRSVELGVLVGDNDWRPLEWFLAQREAVKSAVGRRGAWPRGR